MFLFFLSASSEKQKVQTTLDRGSDSNKRSKPSVLQVQFTADGSVQVLERFLLRWKFWWNSLVLVPSCKKFWLFWVRDYLWRATRDRRTLLDPQQNNRTTIQVQTQPELQMTRHSQSDQNHDPNMTQLLMEQNLGHACSGSVPACFKQ